MSATKDVEIDGMRFMLQKFPGEDSGILFFDLVNVLGESLVMFFVTGAFKAESDVQDQDVVGHIMKAIQSFNGAGDSRAKMDLVKRIISRVRVYDDSGSKAIPVNFNQHFTGALMTAFKLAREVLSYEYKDFLAASPIAKDQ